MGRSDSLNTRHASGYSGHSRYCYSQSTNYLLRMGRSRTTFRNRKSRDVRTTFRRKSGNRLIRGGLARPARMASHPDSVACGTRLSARLLRQFCFLLGSLRCAAAWLLAHASGRGRILHFKSPYIHHLHVLHARFTLTRRKQAQLSGKSALQCNKQRIA